MNTTELFSGTKSFSKVMEKNNHSVFTVDFSAQYSPDLICDIRELDYKLLPEKVDILFASPPCTTFSVASISHYWTDGKPKNQKALDGIAILDAAIKVIKDSSPTWWFIENPRGMMRKVIDEIFTKYDIVPIRHTVTYCQYGSRIMKPTDIWTNAIWWQPRPKCSPGASCHERAGRGSKTGVQGIYNIEWERARGNSAMARGIIPPALFEEILTQTPH